MRIPQSSIRHSDKCVSLCVYLSVSAQMWTHKKLTQSRGPDESPEALKQLTAKSWGLYKTGQLCHLPSVMTHNFTMRVAVVRLLLFSLCGSGGSRVDCRPPSGGWTQRRADLRGNQLWHVGGREGIERHEGGDAGGAEEQSDAEEVRWMWLNVEELQVEELRKKKKLCVSEWDAQKITFLIGRGRKISLLSTSPTLLSRSWKQEIELTWFSHQAWISMTTDITTTPSVAPSSCCCQDDL